MEFNDTSCCALIDMKSGGLAGFQGYSKSAFKQRVKEKFHIKGVYGGEGGFYETGAIFATANRTQPAYKKWLLKVGFKRLREFTNHNHGSKVTLFLYTIEKEKGDIR